MKNFTMVPNPMLKECQISIPARYLYCVLLRYCGQKDYCYPGQETLAEDLGCSSRHIRNLIVELEKNKIIVKDRKGFNRSNTYVVSKTLANDRNSVASLNEGNLQKIRKSKSAHSGKRIPIQLGKSVPTINTYGIRKDKNTFSHVGLEKLRKEMTRLGLKKETKQVIKSLA